MRKLLMIACILQFVFFVGCKSKVLSPEQQARADEYIRKIETPDFVFTATNAQPTNGRTINLTSEYRLRVSKDTIEAYLPYFGRAYTAPMNPSEGGIKFVSTDFRYNVVEKSKGYYEIDIEPNDVNDKIMLRGLYLMLNVSDNGYGHLSVRSTNRQNISFSGRIE